LGDQGDVVSAFVVDALAAGVAAGALAPRHGAARGVLGRWDAAGDDFGGGLTQFGNSRRLPGYVVVVLPSGSVHTILPSGYC
jgi:hypothetical protein